MKTFLLFLAIALGAGRLAAQTSPINHTVRTNAPSPASDYRYIVHAQNPYELRTGRVTYDGLAIELYQARNPAKLLVPYNQNQPPPSLADRLWEQNKSGPSGWSVFSVRF